MATPTRADATRQVATAERRFMDGLPASSAQQMVDHGRVPDLPGRNAVAFAESATEVGQVAKSDIQRDGADRAIGGMGIIQQAIRIRQALLAYERREGESRGREQSLHAS